MLAILKTSLKLTALFSLPILLVFAALYVQAQDRPVPSLREVRSIRWQMREDHALIVNDDVVGVWQAMSLGGLGRGLGSRITVVQLVTADTRLLIAFDELPPSREQVARTVTCIEFYGSQFAPLDRQATLTVGGDGMDEVAVSLYSVN